MAISCNVSFGLLDEMIAYHNRPLPNDAVALNAPNMIDASVYAVQLSDDLNQVNFPE
jgi:hypothetical protein